MEGIIVCFIGDYAICKNEESGEVFNVSKNSIKRCHVGDIIINKEEIWIKKKKEKLIRKIQNLKIAIYVMI